jgi:hypothetical protein
VRGWKLRSAGAFQGMKIHASTCQKLSIHVEVFQGVTGNQKGALGQNACKWTNKSVFQGLSCLKDKVC